MASTISQYKGRYHRTLGKILHKDGALKPKKFLLGTHENKAEWASQRLSKLWSEVREVHKGAVEALAEIGGYAGSFNRITGQYFEGVDFHADEPYWDEEALYIAEFVRKGETHIEVLDGADSHPGAFIERVQGLREDYSVIGFVPASEAAWRTGIKHLEYNIERSADDIKVTSSLILDPKFMRESTRP